MNLNALRWRKKHTRVYERLSLDAIYVFFFLVHFKLCMQNAWTGFNEALNIINGIVCVLILCTIFRKLVAFDFNTKRILKSLLLWMLLSRSSQVWLKQIKSDEITQATCIQVINSNFCCVIKFEVLFLSKHLWGDFIFMLKFGPEFS